jgi:RNA polymerase primary sigma factor
MTIDIIINYINNLNIDLSMNSSKIKIKLLSLDNFLENIDYDLTIFDAEVLLKHPVYKTLFDKRFGKLKKISDIEYQNFVENNYNFMTICDLYLDLNNIEVIYKDDNKENNRNNKYLSYEETIEACKRVEQGDTSARDLLITSNIPLVRSIVKSFLGYGIEYEDLLQEGTIGLMKAVERFDYRKGFRFSTYASWWIKQAMERAIADQARAIRIPVHMVELINRKNVAFKRLESSLNREPTLEELSKELNLPLTKINEIMYYSNRIVSTNTKVGEEDTELELLLPDEKVSVEKTAVGNISKSEAIEFLKNSGLLSKREYEVIALRYGLEDDKSRTLQEVSKTYNVTRERIRQIEAKALAKIRRSGYFSKELNFYALANKKQIKAKNLETDYFNVKSINPRLNLDLFLDLVKLLPSSDQEFYISYRGISLEERCLKKIYKRTYPEIAISFGIYIEDRIREMFEYYMSIIKNNDFNRETALNEVAIYMKNVNLHFMFPSYNFKELYAAVKTLDDVDKNILVMRFGSNLKEYYEFPSDKDYNVLLNKALKDLSKSLKQVRTNPPKKCKVPDFVIKYKGKYTVEQLVEFIDKLDSKYKNIIYLRNGKNLDSINRYPTDKEYYQYANLYTSAMRKLDNLIKNNQSIIDEVPHEKLVEVVKTLSEKRQEIMYLRHGKNLDQTLPWPIPSDGKQQYYNNSYNLAVSKIRSIIKKEELKEVEENLRKLNAQQLKADLFKQYYLIYMDVLDKEDLAIIINNAVDSYVYDELFSINSYCNVKIRGDILEFLKQKRDNELVLKK